MISRNTTTWVYSYDYENRLTRVVHSGTTVQQDYYDGKGFRVKQVAGSSAFTYSYEGLNILYEKNVTGGTTTITKHFYAGALQVAKMVGSGVYYLHQDALGSTRLVATATVTVKFSSDYAPYGPSYLKVGVEVIMYTGKPYDSATGLYYSIARYYDPVSGRFVTQDSYAGDRSDPMTMNLYVYARENPMRYTDPDGHMVVADNDGGDTTTTPPLKIQTDPHGIEVDWAPFAPVRTTTVTLFGITLVVPVIGSPSEVELYALATLAKRGVLPAEVVLSLLIGAVAGYDVGHGLKDDYAYDLAAAFGLATASFFGPEVFFPVAAVVGAYVAKRIIGDPAILADLEDLISRYMP